jgi:hypothetical protein
MICVDSATCAQIVRVLREVERLHPDARRLSKAVLRAGIDQVKRDAEFNNEAPALCRPQAG